ncbi:hypothetical protein K456DRAFT_983871 [Colletotrichum gloeosporioides 23]|nr:hypothetical protein K456DRAFT_983871 [Colletotrichum gloeosporioides 23]
MQLNVVVLAPTTGGQPKKKLKRTHPRLPRPQRAVEPLRNKRGVLGPQEPRGNHIPRANPSPSFIVGSPGRLFRFAHTHAASLKVIFRPICRPRRREMQPFSAVPCSMRIFEKTNASIKCLFAPCKRAV